MVSLVRRWLLTLGATLGWPAAPVSAQDDSADSTDAAILHRARAVAHGSRISLLSDQLAVDAALLPLLETALNRMEALTGRPLDVATLGPRVRVVVSAQTRISHVWRGYDQPRDPRAVVFLNARVVHDALQGRDATYAHELAHILAWRYYSHTLREGLADYLALLIVPGAGIGPMRPGAPAPERIAAQIKRLLGSRMPPPDWLVDDGPLRREYYWASRRFVQYLIERKGLDAFFRLYDSPQPESDLPELYGDDQPTLVRQAGL